MGSAANKTANAAEIDRLALAVAKDPGSKAFIPLADEYGKAGMWNEAAAVLEDGLKACPNFITAMVALGRVYDQMNQPVKATAILEAAVKLSPENLRAHRTLAKLYAAQGSKDAAMRSCRVILAVNHQDQEALALCTTLERQTEPRVSEESRPASAVETGAPASEDIAVVRIGAPSQVAKDIMSGEAPTDSLTPPDPPADSSLQKSAAVVQLEQWLAFIQTRRRDRAA